MQTNDVRAKYLGFFAGQGHAVVPSARLVPENDPTTLFTGSGMQPMVPYLLGEVHPLGSRITDSQKCFRSQDIEEVGDNRHTTFFEMLGNWSLGDYFKKEQIPWMFAFLTKELGLDPARLYVTVFRGNDAIGIPRDDEAIALWQSMFSTVGIEALAIHDSEEHGLQGGRIFSYPEKKNWWSRAGVPGNMPEGEPGGPDTEMFFDFGAERHLHEVSPWKDEPCHVNCDCGRFVEIGNNVFMQYQRTSDGFALLPQQNVDFGGGLERMTAATRNDPDVFLIDIFDRARTGIEVASGKKYGTDDADTYAFRVILDHIRAATFLIADGVFPSNKDQGYFVRRLIRRAVRFARRLGAQGAIVRSASEAFIEAYAGAYPDLAAKREAILTAIETEEAKFAKTLEQGLRELGKIVEKTGTFTAQNAFDLYQTYGFPLELTTEELVRTHQVAVDEDAFRAAFKAHQELSRAGSEQKFKGGLADTSVETTRLHTAHHLLLRALQIVLGGEVHQRGSNITAERLRIDFSAPAKMTDEQKAEVERIVNEKIAEDLPVIRSEIAREEAEKLGAEHEFGAKYPDRVSVYSVGSKDATQDDPKFAERFSLEFCGGPHVTNTGSLGHFHIVKEEAVSAGVRRIKAVLE